VIDKLANGNFGSQFRQAAEMIAVPMCNDQMIYLLKPGGLNSLHDSARIARSRSPGITGVYQQRLVGRPDDQRGVAAFHIDDIDVQRCGKGGHRKKQQHSH
jgi:hypothetical protein